MIGGDLGVDLLGVIAALGQGLGAALQAGRDLLDLGLGVLAPVRLVAGDGKITSDLLEAETGSEARPETAPPDRPSAAPVPDAHAIADTLRAEFSEIATIAAQAARLGIEIDAATSAASERTASVSRIVWRSASGFRPRRMASTARPTGDSPIVKRARERAATAGPRT